MKYSYILIDSNNLWWRSFYRETQNFIAGKGIYTGGILQFFNSIKNIREKFSYINNTQIFLLFDNTVSTLELRKIISNGDYKSHRLTKKAKTFLYKDLEYLKEILKYYDNNFRVVWKEECEADDLVEPLLNTLDINNNNKCLVISVDMDWARATSDNIHWYNYEEVMGRDFFKRKYGFDPKGKSVQLYKAIKGDSADRIKSGIPNMPKNFKDIQDLIENMYESDIPEKWRIKIREREKELRTNYELVDYIDIKDDINKYIVKSRENVRKLEVMFEGRGIPLEERMINPVRKRNNFLKRK